MTPEMYEPVAASCSASACRAGSPARTMRVVRGTARDTALAAALPTAFDAAFSEGAVVLGARREGVATWGIVTPPAVGLAQAGLRPAGATVGLGGRNDAHHRRVRRVDPADRAAVRHASHQRSGARGDLLGARSPRRARGRAGAGSVL